PRCDGRTAICMSGQRSSVTTGRGPTATGEYPARRVLAERGFAYYGVTKLHLQPNRVSYRCFVFGVWCLVFGVWCLVLRVSDSPRGAEHETPNAKHPRRFAYAPRRERAIQVEYQPRGAS